MCTDHGLHLLQGCRPVGAGPSAGDGPPGGSGLSRRAALTAAATATMGLGVVGPAAASGGERSGAGASGHAPPTWAGPPRRRPGRHGLEDLTHVLGPSTPAFTPGEEAVRQTLVTVEADGYYIQEWRIIEHIGTHVDAPGHFAAGGRTADQLTPAELHCPAVVVDIADRAAQDPDTLVTVADLRAFERRHRRIPRDAAVLMYSGWGTRVGDADAYRGTDAGGVLHFPGFAPEAAQWLVEERRVRCLGVDTLSIDRGTSTDFATHLIVNGADRYGLENLANLDRLPPLGARVSVGLIPFLQGSGGQARVFATW